MTDPTALQMELVTAAGAALRFKSMSAREEISRLFDFQIVGISEDNALGADDLLGTPVAVSLEVAVTPSAGGTASSRRSASTASTAASTPTASPPGRGCGC